MWIRLGNPQPREGFFASEEDEAENRKSYRPLEVGVDGDQGPGVLTLTPPDGTPFEEIVSTITAVPQGVWTEHAEPGSSPDWVDSDDPRIARRLAAYFDVPAGERHGYLEPASLAALSDTPVGVDHAAPAPDQADTEGSA